MNRILKIVGIVVAVLLLVVIALPFLINVNSFRPKLESELTTALGREVKVGNLSLSILSGSVSAEDLSIADDPAYSKDPFIRAKSLKVGVEVMPLPLDGSVRTMPFKVIELPLLPVLLKASPATVMLLNRPTVELSIVRDGSGPAKVTCDPEAAIVAG